MTSRETRALAEAIREALDRRAVIDDLSHVIDELESALASRDPRQLDQAVTQAEPVVRRARALIAEWPKVDHATAGRRRSSTERPPRDGETCTCGRPAVVVYITSKGYEVSYCGIPDGGATSHGGAV